MLAAASLVAPLFAASPPAWVGSATHTWSPRLGGGIWHQEGKVVRGIAPALAEYPRPVLVGLRSPMTDMGYRFDLNSWDPNAPNDFGTDRYSHEDVLKVLGASGNAEFIWSMPVPDNYSATPYGGAWSGAGFRWQRPKYYAAYLQYFTAPATMTPAQYNALNSTYNFFTDATCTTVNTASETAVGGNWANLRAKRGRLQPYPLVAVILGLEPYGDANEKFIEDGGRYGVIAQQFRNEIRLRGGALATIPLGLTLLENGPFTDTARPWFHPMLAQVTESDFSYLDLHHHYRFVDPAPTAPLNRVYPAAIHTGRSDGVSPGWTDWWVNTINWASDYSRYLWMYDNIRLALSNVGQDPNRWKLGCAEHGLYISSQFLGNDMGAGVHWALWLAEIMRYNAHWDMNWVLAEQGFSHAQLQYRDDHLTRTPGHYVYKMAQKFYGFEHRANTYTSPSAFNGSFIEGNNPPVTVTYTSPDVVVRVFRNPADGHYHLFVINKRNSGSPAVNIAGWESWTVKRWDRMSAANLSDQNPIGNPWSAETIKTVPVTPAHPLNVPSLSINHIELSETSADWISRADGPGARVGHSTVLADNQVIVWGGGRQGTFLSDGGSFNLANAGWTTLPAGGPSGRWFHSAVWTGSKMIVWGGRSSFAIQNHHNTGALYDPVTGWGSMGTGPLSARSQASAVWTGTEMIIWGGTGDAFTEKNDGARYDPATGQWHSMAAPPAGFEGRFLHTAVWTGKEMIVFGGLKVDGYIQNEVWTSFDTGARYNPYDNTWQLLPAGGGSRSSHTAVWTGSEMIVWGGRALPANTLLNTGARYRPSDNTWATVTGTGAPQGRSDHAGVWTGDEMIIWGGYVDHTPLEVNTGARYAPNAGGGSWTATATTGAPAARYYGRPDSAVWAGDTMFIYGGWYNYPYEANTTAQYAP